MKIEDIKIGSELLFQGNFVRVVKISNDNMVVFYFLNKTIPLINNSAKISVDVDFITDGDFYYLLENNEIKLYNDFTNSIEIPEDDKLKKMITFVLSETRDKISSIKRYMKTEEFNDSSNKDLSFVNSYYNLLLDHLDNLKQLSFELLKNPLDDFIVFEYNNEIMYRFNNDYGALIHSNNNTNILIKLKFNSKSNEDYSIIEFDDILNVKILNLSNEEINNLLNKIKNL